MVDKMESPRKRREGGRKTEKGRVIKKKWCKKKNVHQIRSTMRKKVKDRQM